MEPNLIEREGRNLQVMDEKEAAAAALLDEEAEKPGRCVAGLTRAYSSSRPRGGNQSGTARTAGGGSQSGTTWLLAETLDRK